MEQQKKYETADEELEYYKKAYETEKKKNQMLVGRLAASLEEEKRLQEQIERIKGGTLWKLSKPARVFIHFLLRTKDRVARYGSVKGILRKLKSKGIEKRAKITAWNGKLSRRREKKGGNGNQVLERY